MARDPAATIHRQDRTIRVDSLSASRPDTGRAYGVGNDVREPATEVETEVP
nr:hypothetical protein GCM10025730_14410 [Promicromonospora thailandica]